MEASVMLVDDDDSLHTIVNDALAEDGIKMIHAKSGAECIQHLKDGFWGVILLDVTMPGLDGWSTLEAIVTQGLMKKNAVCMFTAQESLPKKAQALAPHVTGYILKHGSLEKTLAQIKEHLALIGVA
jgi:DNA-binding NtrC family response regulator